MRPRVLVSGCRGCGCLGVARELVGVWVYGIWGYPDGGWLVRLGNWGTWVAKKNRGTLGGRVANLDLGSQKRAVYI